MQLTIAVARYRIAAPADFDCFARRISRLLERAAAQGARIAVLPEYLSLELAWSLGRGVSADLPASLAGIQVYRQRWLELFSGLARRLDMHIVAGSFLLEHLPGRYRNRCDCFTADGRLLWQDKLQLTSFEYLAGVIDPGDSLKVFEIDGIGVAVAICCDTEYAMPVRAQYLAGARLLVVPSSTDTVAGAARIRHHCMARAQQNRMFVAQAVTRGQAAWSPVLDRNTGAAAVLAPHEDGHAVQVLAQSRGVRTWAVATVELARVQRCVAPRPLPGEGGGGEWSV